MVSIMIHQILWTKSLLYDKVIHKRFQKLITRTPYFAETWNGMPKIAWNFTHVKWGPKLIFASQIGLKWIWSWVGFKCISWVLQECGGIPSSITWKTREKFVASLQEALFSCKELCKITLSLFQEHQNQALFCCWCKHKEVCEVILGKNFGFDCFCFWGKHVKVSRRNFGFFLGFQHFFLCGRERKLQFCCVLSYWKGKLLGKDVCVLCGRLLEQLFSCSIFLLNFFVKEREVVGARTFHYGFHVEFWCCFRISSTLRTNENLTWNNKGKWQAKHKAIVRITLMSIVTKKHKIILCDD